MSSSEVHLLLKTLRIIVSHVLSNGSQLKGEVFLTKGNNSERMNYVLENQSAFGLFPRVDGPGVEKTRV